MKRLIRIAAVEPRAGHRVRLQLTSGDVVERGLGDLMRDARFSAIREDEQLFNAVTIDAGTLVWPGDIDVAPETVIWDGPDPDDERPPAKSLDVHRPHQATTRR